MKKLLLLAILFATQATFAHPGRTASGGCHYCRTNCGSWGVPWNERHCHGRVKDDPVEKLMVINDFNLINSLPQSKNQLVDR